MTDDIHTPGERQLTEEKKEADTDVGKKRSSLKVVKTAAPPEILEVPRPSFSLYPGWTLVEGKKLPPGVWWHGRRQAGPGDDGIPVDYRLCDSLYVDAETVDTETGHVGRLLRFQGRRSSVEWVMPMESLAGGGEEVLKALFRLGLAVEYKRRKMVLEYIGNHHHLDKVLETTTKVGWHPSGAFVLPGRIFGSDAVKYQDTGRAAEIFSTRGNLDTWKKEVACLCIGNSVLILSVCCALVGPILSLLGVVGGGFHLVGDSSSGKSLAQRIAATVWGNPDRFAASWAVTKNGLEIEAAARNETVLLLDEIKRADPRYIQEMAYSLANGMGKGTMNAERQARHKLVWLLFFLSSGERPLTEHAALSGNPAHAGAELRMVDINAGTRKFRAFDDTHGMTGEAFHRALSVAVMGHYGLVGPAMVEALIEGKGKDDVPGLYGKLREHFQSDNAQAGRVADRFCAVATAGEYASAKGLLPWRKGTALNACKKLFGEWQETVGTGNTEDRQILQGVANFIAAHGDSRFSSIRELSDNQRVVHNRAGYYDQSVKSDTRLYLFTLPALREAATGFTKERILLALKTADAIQAEEGVKEKKGYQVQHRTPGGGRNWFYVINPERLNIDR